MPTTQDAAELRRLNGSLERISDALQTRSVITADVADGRCAATPGIAAARYCST